MKPETLLVAATVIAAVLCFVGMVLVYRRPRS